MRRLLFVFALLLAGCAPGIQIRHIVGPDGTQTTEYQRAIFVSQNIEGLSISRDPATGRVDIELKGQASEATALNSAVNGLVNLAAKIK